MNKIYKTFLLSIFVLGMMVAGSMAATASVSPMVRPVAKVQSQSKTSTLPGTVTVGALIPLSGDLESIAVGIQDGIKAAAYEVNSTSSMGFKVALNIQDTKVDPTTAVQDYNVLKAAGVQLIIGAAASAASKAVAELAASDHIVQISYASTAASLTNSSYTYFYRVVPSDSFQAKALTALVNHYNYTNIAVVNRDDAYGSGLAANVVSIYNGTAVNVSTPISYPSATTDFSSVVTAVKADTKAQAIILIAFTEDGRSVVTDLRSNGVALPIFGVDGEADNSIINNSIVATSQQDFERFIGTTPHSYTAADTGAHFNKYVNALNACYAASVCAGNDSTRIYGNYAYDAMWVGANAIKLAGTYDGASIKAQMQTAGASYVGATGNKTFDQYGDPTQAAYDVYQFQSGKLTVVGSWDPNAGIAINSNALALAWPGRSTPGFDSVSLLIAFGIIAVIPIIRRKQRNS